LQFGWKRNLRKIPEQVREKVRALPGDNLAITCVKKIPQAHIAEGRYAHLGMGVTDGQLTGPDACIPCKEAGRYSRWNLEGREVVRRDLPKTTKTWEGEAPNYGGNGTHSVTFSRDVYQRDFYPPKGLAIQIELLNRENGDDPTYVVRFGVDEVLDRKGDNFERELLASLNLLQENTGLIDVFSSEATRDDYLSTAYVAWEFLPPGTRDETLAKILSDLRITDERMRERLEVRYAVLAALGPIKFVIGTSGFHRYIGAKFSERLVVFENLEWGNALYAMFEDWEERSRRSRTELLAGDREGFVRIVHTEGWQRRLQRVVDEKR
jgi:hypothetical protein